MERGQGIWIFNNELLKDNCNALPGGGIQITPKLSKIEDQVPIFHAFISENSPVDCVAQSEVKSCNVTKKEEITTKVNKTFSSNYDTTNNDSV